MRIETLSALHCPYCGSGLRISRMLKCHDKWLIDGVIRCECRSHLVVQGIPILRTIEPDTFQSALSYLNHGQNLRALYCLLQSQTRLDRIIRFAGYRHLPFAKLVRRLEYDRIHRHWDWILDAKTFLDLMDRLEMGDTGSYFRYRFSTTSFAAAIPLMMLLRTSRGPVLDLGCGMGHHAYLASRLLGNRPRFFIDNSVLNLYIAKRFFEPDGEFICIDCNNPLPFATDAFGSVFSSDALHYIESKALAFGEIFRVLNDSGTAVFPHLHNQKRKNPTPGSPLSPSGWRNLTSCIPARVIPEENIFIDFIAQGKLNLLHECSESSLDSAAAISVVASHQKNLFRNYEGLRSQWLETWSRLIINPLYEVCSDGNTFRLHKKWDSRFIQEENSAIDRIMPEEVYLMHNILERTEATALSKPEAKELYDFRRQFVLINAPANFSSYSP